MQFREACVMQTYLLIKLQNDVHEEYMNQELKCEWNEFKHNTVMDVINSRGVRPGYGKWAR